MENNKYAIEMIDVTKTFLNGKVVANDKICLRVKQNEVHAIVGENGAGKSTLMSILFGIYQPDSGIIKINGEQVNFASAKDADKYKLGMVHQHFKLIDEFTVWENIILGNENANLLGVIPINKIKQRLNEIIKQYDFKLNINKKVSELTVGQQQKTEILKLLYHNSNILIFDEPTAVLSQDEIVSFLKMIKKFKEEGKTTIIISHKLNEIKEVSDNVTVIRHGKFIGECDPQTKSIDEIAEMMVGKKLVQVKNEYNDISNNPIVLKVKNLDVYKLWKKNNSVSKFKNLINKKSELNSEKISFNIHKSEIFAIAGVEGNGQSELALALCGMLPNGHASIKLNNIELNNKSVKSRIKLGVSSVPEDRHKHGLVLDLPIYMNAVLDRIDDKKFNKWGIIKSLAVKKESSKIIKKYDVRGTTRGTTISRLLSGGNQQKLIIGREMEKPHELLILVQPTRGMDLGAINSIHEQILKEKAQGKSILLISYELDEILSLADTIAVMQNGKILDCKPAKIMTKQKIGQLMVGMD